MAQNTFLNATADKSAASKVDGQDHRHVTSVGSSASGDISITYDSAVITKLTTFDSAVAALRKLAISAGLK